MVGLSVSSLRAAATIHGLRNSIVDVVFYFSEFRKSISGAFLALASWRSMVDPAVLDSRVRAAARRGVAVSSLVSEKSLRAGINAWTRRMSAVPVTCYFSCGNISSSGVSCCMIRHSPLGLADTTGTEFVMW